MDAVGARKKVLECQEAIHKTEWERGSLHKFTLHHRKAGLRYPYPAPKIIISYPNIDQFGPLSLSFFVTAHQPRKRWDRGGGGRGWVRPEREA